MDELKVGDRVRVDKMGYLTSYEQGLYIGATGTVKALRNSLHGDKLLAGVVMDAPSDLYWAHHSWSFYPEQLTKLGEDE